MQALKASAQIKTEGLHNFDSISLSKEGDYVLLRTTKLSFMCLISQAEGSEVSAELDFLNQQNLILSMENKALKQRLESLAQEQLIKYCMFLSFSVKI